MPEPQAFVPIHKDWQRLGYPFGALIPSYATAIGTSGDRPDALAELMGIVASDGYRRPQMRLERLHFAEGTPYETVMKAAPPKGERVLRPEIASVVHRGLVDVVESGTARRAFGVVTEPNGEPMVIGGKTGTGDNRQHRFALGHKQFQSVARSRTATFVFFVGDRYFGTVTAYVEGPEAARYHFTSALPAQLFKMLAPMTEMAIRKSRPKSDWLITDSAHLTATARPPFLWAGQGFVYPQAVQFLLKRPTPTPSTGDYWAGFPQLDYRWPLGSTAPPMQARSYARKIGAGGQVIGLGCSDKILSIAMKPGYGPGAFHLPRMPR